MIAAAATSVSILLLVVALVLFALAAIISSRPVNGVRSWWASLIAVGLAAWVLAILLPRL